MENAYWLSRKRAALKLARNAASSAARLIHYDLAGRYSLKAMAAEAADMDPRGEAAHKDESNG
jgi:hypothetical protein